MGRKGGGGLPFMLRRCLSITPTSLPFRMRPPKRDFEQPHFLLTASTSLPRSFISAISQPACLSNCLGRFFLLIENSFLDAFSPNEVTEVGEMEEVSKYIPKYHDFSGLVEFGLSARISRYEHGNEYRARASLFKIVFTHSSSSTNRHTRNLLDGFAFYFILYTYKLLAMVVPHDLEASTEVNIIHLGSIRVPDEKVISQDSSKLESRSPHITTKFTNATQVHERSTWFNPSKALPQFSPSQNRTGG